MQFAMKRPFAPAGDQPRAIEELAHGLTSGFRKQTLLGTTGSGKTATMSFLLDQIQKPALVISHNKTLAAQLTEEFKEFFPDNSINYFVSYYDYYQPEAYIPRTDTYIAKDASINEEIDKLRHAAMEAILTRTDVIVVASVSCIYGLGSPKEYLEARIELIEGMNMNRKTLLQKLTNLQYSRGGEDTTRGTYRARGDVIDIHPSGEDSLIRVEFFGDTIDRISHMDSLTGTPIGTSGAIGSLNEKSKERALIFPATFFMTTSEQKKTALSSIRIELAERTSQLKQQDKLLEAQRLEQRTAYDIEMIDHIGYVSGIENYSRHLDQRAPGEPPATLIDYFMFRYGQTGFVTFIDESHITVPQLGSMYAGDFARKKSLVEHGFRLPSAYDNRPLQFHEFESRVGQTIFASATPALYERSKSKQIVEQIVRPTGLLDPTIEIKPLQHQVDDVIEHIQKRVKHKQRVLVTTLTKRMSEELATYLRELGIKAAYIHSDIDTLERLDILRDLRAGTYDVLVGINLLREGLDLPEVSLVAILDADKEGYLRSETALVQVMGRAARHVEGHVVMYADRVTGSMKRAIDETDRRREIQRSYNKKHNITPRTIQKNIRDFRLLTGIKAESSAGRSESLTEIPPEERTRVLKDLQQKMHLAASNLEFEKAASIRDRIREIRTMERTDG